MTLPTKGYSATNVQMKGALLALCFCFARHLRTDEFRENKRGGPLRCGPTALQPRDHVRRQSDTDLLF